MVQPGYDLPIVAWSNRVEECCEQEKSEDVVVSDLLVLRS